METFRWEAGLSSSASIEVVTAVMLNDVTKVHLDMTELVKISQKAENDYVGVNCGIMDQFAVGMGKANHAIRSGLCQPEIRVCPFTYGRI